MYFIAHKHSLYISMQLKHFTLLAIFVLLAACGNKSDRAEAIENHYISDTVAKKEVPVDSLDFFLKQAATADSFEYGNSPFLYLKTGHLANAKVTSAIVVDTSGPTYAVSLYKLNNNEWKLADRVDSLHITPAFFNVNLQDYNFDGTQDVFLTIAVSNGMPVVIEHLITIDKTGEKLTLINGFDKIGNPTPDNKRKQLKSRPVIDCNFSANGPQGWRYCDLVYVWKGNSLKRILEKCPCEGDKGYE